MVNRHIAEDSFCKAEFMCHIFLQSIIHGNQVLEKFRRLYIYCLIAYALKYMDLYIKYAKALDHYHLDYFTVST